MTVIPDDCISMPANGPVVAWDGLGLTNVNSGVGQHARQMLASLDQLGIHPTVLLTPGQATDDVLDPSRKSCQSDRLPSRNLPSVRWLNGFKPLWPIRSWNYVTRLARRNPDRTFILHGLSNINLPAVTLRCPPNVRRVITIHDLIPLIDPKASTRSLYLQFWGLLPFVVRGADRIICVSNWTRDHVVRRFPSAESKIHVIENGHGTILEASTTNRPPEDRVRLICVSRDEPYKRLELLLDLLMQSQNLQLTLVTNSDGQRRLSERPVVRALKAAGRLHLLVGISDEELDRLMRQADCYVQPSRLEGYCLPAIHALRCGVPVVYQSGSGIDEVCGDRVAMPMRIEDGPDQWVAGIAQMLATAQQPGYAEALRQHLRDRISWDQAAGRLAGVYQSLALPGAF